MLAPCLTILTGASRGLGLAMAQALLEPGQHLLTLARHPDGGLPQLARERGATLEQWSADLVDALPASQRLRQWLAGFAASHFENITLINNAGVLAAIAPLRDAQSQGLAQALRVGLEAPMLLTAAFLDATRDWRGARRVLNISSGLGRRPMASQSAYCAAKAGLDLFTRCIALEEASQPNGARVCALAPGVIDTSMQVQLRIADAEAFPDRDRFQRLQADGQLSSPQVAARQVLDWLERPDFGREPLADVRDAG